MYLDKKYNRQKDVGSVEMTKDEFLSLKPGDKVICIELNEAALRSNSLIKNKIYTIYKTDFLYGLIHCKEKDSNQESVVARYTRFDIYKDNIKRISPFTYWAMTHGKIV